MSKQAQESLKLKISLFTFSGILPCNIIPRNIMQHPYNDGTFNTPRGYTESTPIYLCWKLFPTGASEN